MLTRIADLLGPAETAEILSRLGDLCWEEGAETALAVAGRKRNLELPRCRGQVDVFVL